MQEPTSSARRVPGKCPDRARPELDDTNPRRLGQGGIDAWGKGIATGVFGWFLSHDRRAIDERMDAHGRGNFKDGSVAGSSATVTGGASSGSRLVDGGARHKYGCLSSQLGGAVISDRVTVITGGWALLTDGPVIRVLATVDGRVRSCTMLDSWCTEPQPVGRSRAGRGCM